MKTCIIAIVSLNEETADKLAENEKLPKNWREDEDSVEKYLLSEFEILA